MRAKSCVFLVVSLFSTSAHAFTITAVGAVKALTDVSQMTQVTGQANFEEGPVNTPVAAGQYAQFGLTFYQGPLSGALNGVTAQGNCSFPQYADPKIFGNFPPPSGGGVQMGQFNIFAGCATFSVPITQVGLTAGPNGDQYLTAWDTNGKLLGQVNWSPLGDASFVGLDSFGVPIGLVTYGNDDVYGGASYDLGGATNISDSWLWGPGAPPKPCMVDADCSDGNDCNGIEYCDQVKKTCAINFKGCDDNNPCTTDTCDPVTGCAHASLDNVPCKSPDACITQASCNMGVCEGVPVNCDDKNVCTQDDCDHMTGCTHTPVPGKCDDGTVCTKDDTCQNGKCIGEPIDCNDANICTDDHCDPKKGCIQVPNTAFCDDGDPCTANDTCANAKCVGQPYTCDDSDACTTDTCQGDGTCLNAPVMGCLSCFMDGMSVNCDDGDACTEESCTAAGCEHTPIAGCCNSAKDCSEGESCKAHQCKSPAGAKDGGCSCTTLGDDRDDKGAIALVACAFAIAMGARRRLSRAKRSA